MSDIIVPSIIKSYNGKNIRINPVTKYVCLTDMATASGKQIGHWIELKGTTEYLKAFELAVGIPIETLLYVGDGSTGTWAHQKIAIQFAQWCSPEFAIQVDFWIDELLTTGSVVLKPKTPLELAKEQVKLHEALELQAIQIKLLEDDNTRQAEVIDELFDYSSIIRIAKYNKCSETEFKWSLLKAASKALKLEVKSAPCPRFVTKNLYSHDAWRLAYPLVNLPETTTLVINN